MSRAILALAALAGHTVRLTLSAGRNLGLSVLGVGAIVAGLWMAWPPLAFIALGASALVADWGRAR